MDSRVREVFCELEPPPGGPAALRARLEQEDRRRPRAHIVGWTAAALAAAVAAIVLLTLRGSEPLTGGRDLVLADEVRPVLMRLGIVDLPAESVSVPPAHRHRQAVMEVPVADRNVVLYWVQSVGEDGAPGEALQSQVPEQ